MFPITLLSKLLRVVVLFLNFLKNWIGLTKKSSVFKEKDFLKRDPSTFLMVSLCSSLVRGVKGLFIGPSHLQIASVFS